MVINRTLTLKGLPGHFRRLATAIPTEVAKRIVPVAEQFSQQMKTKTFMDDVIDRGGYQRAWKARRLPLYLTSMTYNDVKDQRSGYGYSTIVELGRRAGARRPPITVIRNWIERRWGYSREEADKIAGAVATKIGRDGIRPRRVMTDGDAIFMAFKTMQVYMNMALEAALARP